MTRQEIRNFYGHILGYIDTESNGKKTARNFYFKILGTYNPSEDTTRDFYGRIISKGDVLSGLILENNNDGKG